MISSKQLDTQFQSQEGKDWLKVWNWESSQVGGWSQGGRSDHAALCEGRKGPKTNTWATITLQEWAEEEVTLKETKE